MSAAGYTPIQLYYSTTVSQQPLAANLASGELAINITDGKLYYKDNTGAVKIIASSAGATGNLPGGNTGTVVYQSATGVTAYLPLATAGFVLAAGASAPAYINPNTLTVGTANNATNATNIAGGAASQIVYQSATGVTAFAPAPSVAGLVLGWTGTAFNWVAAPAATTATNLAGGAAFEVPYQSAPNTTQFSPNFQFNGTYLRVGDTAPLSGATNPTFAATGDQDLYVQSYIYNANAGASASADFVAYSDLSTDVHGWADLGYTSSGYADPVYTVTGACEAYVFGSAPSGSGTTGNLVYATDSTGTANAHQWYVGGFTQAKSAWKMQLTSTGLQLANALAAAYGGTGLTSPGGAGNLLTSTGTGWASLPAPVTGPSTAKTYYMAQF
jgi:hypothetical protein